MARILVALVALGFVASLAPAETVIMEITCDRDNFNVNYTRGDPTSGFTAYENDWNCGGTSSWRVAKGKQEGTYYSDWAHDELVALGEAIALGPADPANWLEVHWVMYGTSTYANTTKSTFIETLDSMTDWVEGTQNRSPSTAGACDDYASIVPGPVPWVDAVAAPGTQRLPISLGGPGFWGLTSAFANSINLVGWQEGTTTPNVLPLDMPLVMHLINDQNNRGLRLYGNWDGGVAENASGAALTQWGSLGGAKLRLVEVPEPASMLLLGIGGVAVLLRKKR